VIDPATHVTLSANKNPHLAWSGVPAATKSLVLVVHDPDVPSRGDDVNQEGKTVPADCRASTSSTGPWSTFRQIPNRSQPDHCQRVTPRGKSGRDRPCTDQGARHGINDYTGWFAQDADMAGAYFGYDGPCPPWNDAIVHRYVFTLYALDIASVPLDGEFTGQQVRAAIDGHVLDQASFSGSYTLNPALAD